MAGDPFLHVRTRGPNYGSTPQGPVLQRGGRAPDGIELNLFEREMDRIIHAATYYADVWKEVATVAGEYAVEYRFSGNVTDETLRLALSFAEQFPALGYPSLPGMEGSTILSMDKATKRMCWNGGRARDNVT